MSPAQPQFLHPEHDARYGTVRDGVCVLAPDWRIRYANASLLEILRLLGGGQGVETLWDALPGWRETPEGEALRRAMEDRRPVRFTVDPSRAGDRVWEVEAEPLASGELRVRLHNATARAPREAPVGGAGGRLGPAAQQSGVALAVVEAGSWKLVEANAPALALLGGTGGGGRRLPELLGRWPLELERRLERVAATGEPWTQSEVGFRVAGAARRWFHLDVRRMEPPGAPILLVGAAIEVTGAVEARRAADAERAALARAGRAKGRFLATMGHELRTPLHALEGYAQLLENGVYGPVSEAQSRTLGRMRSSQRQLLTLIEQVLDAVRLEANAQGLQPGDVDLADLAAGLVEALRPTAEREALVLELEAEPTVIRTDAGLLRQVLTNVVGNALKFTGQGRVRVTVRRSGAAAEIAVEDTGPGIAAEHLEQIWEPFFQVSPARHGREGGTGLGLALSREYVHLLGGRIRVESEVGRGSTFVLTLPSLAEPT